MGRLWVLLVCASCAHGAAGGASSGGDATFSIAYPDAPASGVTATRGKRFYAKPVGRCFYANGHEARWTIGGARVTSGELPPGLTLEDGQIGGVPTQPGTYTFHIEFSNVMCAGTPYAGQAVDGTITVK